MNKNQSLLFRLLLFFAGAGVVTLAFVLLRADPFTDRDAFVWISIGVLYLIFFVPFFFSIIKAGSFSGKIPSLAQVWFSVFLYAMISIGIIVLVLVLPFDLLNVFIILQSILLFLFAVSMYFAYFASAHVGKVALEEVGKQQHINRIKPKAQALLLAVNGLPGEHEKTQATLKQALEDIRYIYPVDGGAGSELELQILRSLDTVSELCGGVSDGARPISLEAEADRLRMLVKERKLLRN